MAKADQTGAVFTSSQKPQATLFQLARHGLPSGKSSQQLVRAFAAPHHQTSHSHRQQDWHCNKWDKHFIWGILPVGPAHGAVGKKLPVDVSDEVLGQWVGPVATHEVGLYLRAISEAFVVPAGVGGETAALPTPIIPAPPQDPNRQAGNSLILVLFGHLPKL